MSSNTPGHGSRIETAEDLPQDLRQELDRLEELFTVDTAMLKKITNRFGEELEDGLNAQGCNIPMNITWVSNLPTGRETGTYLTLDLGGTNLRVCLITLKGTGGKTTPEKAADVTQENYTLPKKTKTGTAEELWTFVTQTLQEFVDKYNLQAEGEEGGPGKLPLGFTFSYPATQDRIDHGLLQTWTKGWDVKGVEGQDVAEMLRQAIQKRNLPIELVALINDTTGALIASAYNDPKTIIGAIFGTGCNAAYMEQLRHIPKIRNRESQSHSNCPRVEASEDGLMAINCEYGAFDNSHSVLPRTRYDELVDEQSPRPGEQTFEKMSAGLYLGEILRLVLVELQDKGIIFKNPAAGMLLGTDGDGEATKTLNDPYVLDTEFLSLVENDESPSLASSRKAFEATLRLAPSAPELVFSQALAKLIAIRGARLCACGVSAICTRMGTNQGHVAADGSVAIKHPKFRERWEGAVAEVLGIEVGGIELTSAEDGSGVGAAVICALTMGNHGQ